MSLRTLTARLPLRRLLTLPYVALILALVLLVGALSWRAGRDTVDSLSGQLIGEVVSSEIKLIIAFGSGIEPGSC